MQEKLGHGAHDFSMQWTALMQACVVRTITLSKARDDAVEESNSHRIIDIICTSPSLHEAKRSYKYDGEKHEQYRYEEDEGA